MVISVFAFLMGFACVASIAMFATDGEKFWNWVILFLGLAYPYVVMPFFEFPEGYEPSSNDKFGEIFIFSLKSAVSTHVFFLGLGLVLAIGWVLYQEGTLQWVIRRVKGEVDEDWD